MRTHGHSHTVSPFKEYGPGILQYFRMIKFMIFIFALLSLMIAPVMWLYTRSDSYSHIPNFWTNYILKPSLGNLGHSMPQCMHQTLSIDHDFHL